MQNGGLDKYITKHFPDYEKAKKYIYTLTVPVHLRVKDRHETQDAKLRHGLSDKINGIAKEKRVSAPRHTPKKAIDDEQL
jgi:hypothetical protein